MGKWSGSFSHKTDYYEIFMCKECTEWFWSRNTFACVILPQIAFQPRDLLEHFFRNSIGNKCHSYWMLTIKIKVNKKLPIRIKI
jgi:hypothetical protein